MTCLRRCRCSSPANIAEQRAVGEEHSIAAQKLDDLIKNKHLMGALLRLAGVVIEKKVDVVRH